MLDTQCVFEGYTVGLVDSSCLHMLQIFRWAFLSAFTMNICLFYPASISLPLYYKVPSGRHSSGQRIQMVVFASTSPFYALNSIKEEIGHTKSFWKLYKIRSNLRKPISWPPLYLPCLCTSKGINFMSDRKRRDEGHRPSSNAHVLGLEVYR